MCSSMIKTTTTLLAMLTVLTVLASAQWTGVVQSGQQQSGGQLASEDESSAAAANTVSIESMMTEAERRGMSVVFNTRGRMMPLIFNPLSDLVTSIKPLTVVKLGAAYSAIVYVVAYLFPSVFGLSAAARSLGGVYSLPMTLDYDSVYRSVTTASARVGTFMQIPEPECRYRAVCEAATYVATKVPVLNDWAKKVSGAFFLNLANPYSKAWINGMMQIDCGQTYYQCQESPYRTLMNRFVAKR